MLELLPHQFPIARPVFLRMDHFLAVTAMLDEKLPGRIFVDTLDHPRCALACTHKRLYLAGEGSDSQFLHDLRAFITQTALPRARSSGLPMIVLYDDPQGWETWKDTLLAGLDPIPARREYHTIPSGSRLPVPAIPDGFSLRSVDRELMDNSHLQNLDALLEEISSEGTPLDRFLADGIGVCLVHKDELVGWCLSEYNCAGRCEIGIETLPDYQRRGFANLMTRALLNRAFQRGFSQVGWHCFTRNLPSVAAAGKAGFTRAVDYLAYLLPTGLPD